MQQPFFTIGHSTRTIDEFAGLLRENHVRHVIDIRTVPRSRTNPQFNRDVMPEALEPFGLTYEHSAALGGLRGKAKDVAPEVNGMWGNQSFHNYADYALSAEFAEGLRHLIETGRDQQTAVMCSEAVWWRCHRRIVADYLLARDEPVFHIMGEGRADPAHLTSGALVLDNKSVVYPPPSARGEE